MIRDWAEQQKRHSGKEGRGDDPQAGALAAPLPPSPSPGP